MQFQISRALPRRVPHALQRKVRDVAVYRQQSKEHQPTALF